VHVRAGRRRWRPVHLGHRWRGLRGQRATAGLPEGTGIAYVQGLSVTTSSLRRPGAALRAAGVL